MSKQDFSIKISLAFLLKVKVDFILRRVFLDIL